MLFHVTWQFKDTSEEGERRSLDGVLALAAARRERISRASTASPTAPAASR